MKRLNVASSIVALYLYLAYFLHNFFVIGAVGGETYLLCSLILIGLNIYPSNYRFFLRLTIEVFMCIMFMTYYFIRIIIDNGLVISLLKSEFFETTSGICFYFLLGIFGSLINTTIQFLSNKKQLRFHILFIQVAVILILSLCLFLYFGEIRENSFLVEDDMGAYQRPGNMMIILFLMLCFINEQWLCQYKHDIKSNVISYYNPMIIALILFLISQVIGSNMGAVTVFILCIITVLNTSWNENVVLRRVSKIDWLLLLVQRLVSFMLVIYTIINVFGLDFNGIHERFRILGFGQDEVSSFHSRYEIFKDNFWIHINNSPIFGNSKVEKETTGEGTYIHSLLSVLTHTGIFGSFLLFMSFINYYLNNSTVANLSNKSCNSLRFESYKRTILLSILCCCMFATTFTWSPLWFTIGYCYQPLFLKK